MEPSFSLFRVLVTLTCFFLIMPKFSDDFYEFILEASEKGELWGIENTDLTPLEIHLILTHIRNQ